jgi:hypothetical protein
MQDDTFKDIENLQILDLSDNKEILNSLIQVIPSDHQQI